MCQNNIIFFLFIKNLNMKSHLLSFFTIIFAAFTLNAQVTSVGIIGSATPGGWDLDTQMTQVDDSTWTLDIVLIGGEAKFRANGAWDVNWGDSAFPQGVGTQGGPNIPIFAGDYTVTFNSNSGAYNFAVASDIGIIGDATPGGWDNDTNMFRDEADTNAYFIVLNLGLGSAKFRANDGWDINWGAEDFPAGVGLPGGPNIPIAAAGKYRVDFNKSTGAYNFSEVVDYATIGLIGSATAGGWDTDTPLTRDSGNPDLWKGTTTLVPGELKFRANEAWTFNWGGGVFPTDTASAGGDNIVVVDGGDYLVSFNVKTLIYNFQLIGNYGSVGIIGDATPGGWDNDTDMVQDENDKSIWTLRVELTDGEAKFRADNDWPINWGGADFPAGVATQDGANIPVAAGDYKVTFNSTTGEYNFEAVVEFGQISLVGKSGPFGAWPGTDDGGVNDTYLTKDAVDPNHWTASGIVLTDFDAADTGGSGVKFRAETAWDTNWGAADFPTGLGTPGGANIECLAGIYNIDFRSDTGDYAFADASSTYDLLSSDVINIFPNPATNVLNININTDVLQGNVIVTLFSVNGSVVSTQQANANGQVRVDISNVKAGNYLVRISNDKNLVSKSIVITK